MSQAFRIAVDRLLPQVLTAAVNQRRLQTQVAQNVLSSVNNWFPQFMQACPKGQLTEQQIAEFLDQFISQNAGGGQPQVIINSPTPPQYGNNQFGYMGNQNAPSSVSPFGGVPQNNAYVPNPVKAPLFAQTKPPGVSAGGSVFAPIAEAEPEVAVVEDKGPVRDVSPYVPKWLADNSNIVSTNNNLTEKTKINRKLYPADDRAGVFARYDVVTDSLLSSNNDLFGYVSQLTAGDSDYVVGLNYKGASVVSVPSTEMADHITKLTEIVDSTDPHGLKLKKVIKYLKQQSISVYNAFERIIIGKFNESLKARCMHDSNSIGLKVAVMKLDNILSFLPEQPDPSIAKIVSNSQYQHTFNSVLDLVFSQIRSMEVSADKMHIRNALSTVKGMDGIRMLAQFDTDSEEFTKTFVTESTVIVVPMTVVFTNMDLMESVTAVDALDNEDASVVKVKTCAFDNIIGSFLTRVGPVRVVLTNGYSMIVARTVDQEMVFAG